ncbi:MAG TPA: 3-deoxy-D-manno-octulosonic acid transferase, partial [Burkholderiaceae bacterium]|nr:3-deoxy-D-manno-octulosonic acid transferase [Burkholderiaceae bacterium]
AVSVGETRAAQPLVRELLARYPRHRLLLTHMTPTGLDTGRELFGPLMEGGEPRVLQALLPWDYPFAMRRFLRAWRPSVGVIMETELWPNLVAQSRRQGVPLALVSGRLSARSLRKGLRWSWLMRPALAGLDLVLAQTEADAQRLAQLGREDVPVVGNLKFDVAPMPKMEALGHAWRLGLLAGEAGQRHRPTVLLASTRDGEESLLLDAWIEWRETEMPESGSGASPAPAEGMPWPPLLVIVPRHPQRFGDVARAITSRGLRLVRRSHWGERKPPPPDRAADVLLGDSMGEMFAYYAMADAAIIGGSLLPFGGQNLIEACAAGVPVVVGPHMFNFESATDQAIAEDAALRAPDPAAALRTALAIVADPVRRETMGERALAFATRHRGATARTMGALAKLVDERLP